MSEPTELVSSFLRSEIDRGAFPSAQYLIGESGQIEVEGAIGRAVVDPEHIDVRLDTIYDLASLTKPLITSLLSVILSQRGLLDLDAPLARYLSEAGAGRNGEHRLEALGRQRLTQLLTHTSGLANWLPLYLEAEDASGVPAAIAANGLDPASSIDAQVIYSDLGYILLGLVLERVTGQSLDQLARREIFAPLALERTMFNPPRELIREIAATEHGQAFERENTCASEMRSHGGAERGYSSDPEKPGQRVGAGSQRLSVPLSLSLHSRAHGGRVPPARSLRTGVIWGEVHDANAYFLGGVAGHAGLFSTAREAFLIANQFLPGSRLLDSDALRLFTENLTPGRGADRSIGWVLASTEDCSAGPDLPLTAFGHTGFTGTSIWIDPEKRRVLVLLTNRVHPHVGSISMKEPRRRFHSVAVAALAARR